MDEVDGLSREPPKISKLETLAGEVAAGKSHARPSRTCQRRGSFSIPPPDYRARDRRVFELPQISQCRHEVVLRLVVGAWSTSADWGRALVVIDFGYVGGAEAFLGVLRDGDGGPIADARGYVGAEGEESPASCEARYIPRWEMWRIGGSGPLPHARSFRWALRWDDPSA